MILPDSAIKLLFLPDEASTAASGIDALHLAVISTTLFGSLGIGVLVLWYVAKYRRRSGEDARPTIHLVASSSREWGLGGAILTLFIAFWWVGYHQFLSLRNPPAGSMRVYVTAKQWTWKFTFDDGSSSNDILIVPLGRPIELVLTSRDVIHSFYVPAFRVKHDAVPGRYVSLWFQPTEMGDFDIFCAEYCGLSHSNMHGVVRVVSPENYAKLRSIAQADRSGDDLVAQGERVAVRRQCVACHTVDGQSHLGPSWSHLYGSWQTMNDGRRIYVDEEYLTRSMMDPNADIVAGYSTVMPSYKGSLDPAETGALLAYIRSLRDGAPRSGVALPSFVPASTATQPEVMP